MTYEFLDPLSLYAMVSPSDEKLFQALGKEGTWTTGSQEGGEVQSSHLLRTTAVKAHMRLLLGDSQK